MHNISTPTTNITDSFIDLEQSPADLLFLSVADTELNCLNQAYRSLSSDFPLTLRLANLGVLTNPDSITRYCERTVHDSKMIIIRCLGGMSYWSHGLQTIHALCVSHSISLVVLSGDDKPDEELHFFNTVPESLHLRFFDYFAHGGVDNFILALELAHSHIFRTDTQPLSARPLLKSGLWLPTNSAPTIEDIDYDSSRSTVAIIFYRSLLLAANTESIESLHRALRQENLNVLPIFVSSLKDDVSCEVIRRAFSVMSPRVVLNLTGFSVSTAGESRVATVLEEGGAIVLQAILAGCEREDWHHSAQGLSSRDLAMNIALPEVDGRILSRAIAFKSESHYDPDCQVHLVRHIPDENRVSYVASLASRWISLGEKSATERRVALVLANYPNRDGRLGNGVGLDTPASTMRILRAMSDNNYTLSLPADDESLMRQLSEGITNASQEGREIRETLSLSSYQEFFSTLPSSIRESVESRWGDPTTDPFYLSDTQSFALPILPLGNVLVCIQPARGYNIDPEQSFHSPDLVPPHNYFAFYFYLRFVHCCDALVHVGKHGNLEWLPGKALSLSPECFPECVLGPMPHIYPFIVNDPGEGSQAKRRTSAVIIDHLTPPLTRAETYGILRDLEGLVDEYYEAQGLDPRRADYLRHEIFHLMEDSGLSADMGVSHDESDYALEKLDSYLCELKEAQIRDGLHILGESPTGRLRTDLALCLSRVPRRWGEGGDASLLRAMSTDFQLDFDPLDCDYAQEWLGPRPSLLEDVSSDSWRTYGDTIERMELLSIRLLESGDTTTLACTTLACPTLACPSMLPCTFLVLESLRSSILPSIDSCGTNELSSFLLALDGKFVLPGPSGAPSRGRHDVLPTGRNFFSLDSRSVPTPAAWHLGFKSAELLLTRHREDHGSYPRSLGLSVWGTSNMRTGGDDIAQALALIGVRPKWDSSSRRVVGFDIITPTELGRPRVDVTLRISGFFRDAFPTQIELFDTAVRAVCELDEDDEFNPLSAHIRDDIADLVSSGVADDVASQVSGFRIFGSKPGSYGAGLQAMIDENGWQDRSDLASAYLSFGGYAYGGGGEGRKEHNQFVRRLSTLDAIVHNQDNREHDLLDSDDYYQFEGGMSASVEHLRGAPVPVYHNDHSRPERPIVRTLEEEISRVVRSRVVNPKWISGVMRHKYKGAFELSASVDYLFAFAATTGAVRDHHFDAVYDAYLCDTKVRDFLLEYNPDALRDISFRLLDALDRGLWTSRSNSVKLDLLSLCGRD